MRRKTAAFSGAMTRLALAVGMAAACAPRAETPASGEPAPEMPVPSPGRGLSAVADNARCVECHADVAAEWRGSLHARAYVEPAYQRALAIEPLPFCRTCHAPEADPEHDVPEPIASLGVGCVSCHVSNGAIVAAPLDGIASPAPHLVVRDARFASSAACASCHEFAFPDSALRDEPLLMQSTVSEHARSAHAEQSCASCHMPRQGRRRGHAFAASRNETVVRSAVDVRARRLDARRVQITLAPRDVGHAFPTGDLFRRIEVSIEAVGPEWSRVSGSERYLARHFATERRGTIALRQLAYDDRVGAQGPAARVVELDVGAQGASLPIAWRVAYQRVEHPLGIGSDAARVGGEIVLGSGVLEAP